MSSILELEFSVSLLVIITNTMLYFVLYMISFMCLVLGLFGFRYIVMGLFPKINMEKHWHSAPRDTRVQSHKVPEAFSSRMTKRRILS